MSTHDYVIDNQSAPSFRADLNLALQAIVTQNSSATAPPTTYANMIWYDEANNQIKKRNEANSAWVTLGTIDESLGTFTPTGGVAIATQAEAEAGTDNTKMITPLRVRNAFNATGAAPVYACRAWGNFAGGSPPTLRASGNVSSVVRNSEGLFTVNLTQSVSSNYSIVALVTDSANASRIVSGRTLSTSSFQLQTLRPGDGSSQDVETVTFAIFR